MEYDIIRTELLCLHVNICHYEEPQRHFLVSSLPGYCFASVFQILINIKFWPSLSENHTLKGDSGKYSLTRPSDRIQTTTLVSRVLTLYNIQQRISRYVKRERHGERICFRKSILLRELELTLQFYFSEINKLEVGKYCKNFSAFQTRNGIILN